MGGLQSARWLRRYSTVVVSVFAIAVLCIGGQLPLGRHYASQISSASTGSGVPESIACNGGSKDPSDCPNAAAFVRAAEKVCADGKYGNLWKMMCRANFVALLDEFVNRHSVVRIIQIGAHTGWEVNDPFAKGITAFLNLLPEDMRQTRLEYTMVEASPVNYKNLEQNVEEHSALCTFNLLHAGVVPDSQEQGQDLLFYSIDSTVDVDTGFDSRSGKTLPAWATQISSFEKSNVLKHGFAWKALGLDIKDYIVENQIRTIRFSELVGDLGNTLFVMIDTEGLDCDIVSAIPRDAMPPYLLFEKKHCDSKNAQQHLKDMGFAIEEESRPNYFVHDKQTMVLPYIKPLTKGAL